MKNYILNSYGVEIDFDYVSLQMDANILRKVLLDGYRGRQDVYDRYCDMHAVDKGCVFNAELIERSATVIHFAGR